MKTYSPHRTQSRWKTFGLSQNLPLALETLTLDRVIFCDSTIPLPSITTHHHPNISPPSHSSHLELLNLPSHTSPPSEVNRLCKMAPLPLAVPHHMLKLMILSIMTVRFRLRFSLSNWYISLIPKPTSLPLDNLIWYVLTLLVTPKYRALKIRL